MDNRLNLDELIIAFNSQDLDERYKATNILDEYIKRKEFIYIILQKIRSSNDAFSLNLLSTLLVNCIKKNILSINYEEKMQINKSLISSLELFADKDEHVSNLFVDQMCRAYAINIKSLRFEAGINDIVISNIDVLMKKNIKHWIVGLNLSKNIMNELNNNEYNDFTSYKYTDNCRKSIEKSFFKYCMDIIKKFIDSAFILDDKQDEIELLIITISTITTILLCEFDNNDEQESVSTPNAISISALINNIREEDLAVQLSKLFYIIVNTMCKFITNDAKNNNSSGRFEESKFVNIISNILKSLSSLALLRQNQFIKRDDRHNHVLCLSSIINSINKALCSQCLIEWNRYSTLNAAQKQSIWLNKVDEDETKQLLKVNAINIVMNYPDCFRNYCLLLSNFFSSVTLNELRNLLYRDLHITIETLNLSIEDIKLSILIENIIQIALFRLSNISIYFTDASNAFEYNQLTYNYLNLFCILASDESNIVFISQSIKLQNEFKLLFNTFIYHLIAYTDLVLVSDYVNKIQIYNELLNLSITIPECNKLLKSNLSLNDAINLLGTCLVTNKLLFSINNNSLKDLSSLPNLFFDTAINNLLTELSSKLFTLNYISCVELFSEKWEKLETTFKNISNKQHGAYIEYILIVNRVNTMTLITSSLLSVSANINLPYMLSFIKLNANECIPCLSSIDANFLAKTDSFTNEEKEMIMKFDSSSINLHYLFKSISKFIITCLMYCGQTQKLMQNFSTIVYTNTMFNIIIQCFIYLVEVCVNTIFTSFSYTLGNNVIQESANYIFISMISIIQNNNNTINNSKVINLFNSFFESQCKLSKGKFYKMADIISTLPISDELFTSTNGQNNSRKLIESVSSDKRSRKIIVRIVSKLFLSKIKSLQQLGIQENNTIKSKIDIFLDLIIWKQVEFFYNPRNNELQNINEYINQSSSKIRSKLETLFIDILGILESITNQNVFIDCIKWLYDISINISNKRFTFITCCLDLFLSNNDYALSIHIFKIFNELLNNRMKRLSYNDHTDEQQILTFLATFHAYILDIYLHKSNQFFELFLSSLQLDSYVYLNCVNFQDIKYKLMKTYTNMLYNSIALAYNKQNIYSNIFCTYINSIATNQQSIIEKLFLNWFNIICLQYKENATKLFSEQIVDTNIYIFIEYLENYTICIENQYANNKSSLAHYRKFDNKIFDLFEMICYYNVDLILNMNLINLHIFLELLLYGLNSYNTSINTAALNILTYFMTILVQSIAYALKLDISNDTSAYTEASKNRLHYYGNKLGTFIKYILQLNYNKNSLHLIFLIILQKFSMQSQKDLHIITKLIFCFRFIHNSNIDYFKYCLNNIDYEDQSTKKFHLKAFEILFAMPLSLDYKDIKQYLSNIVKYLQDDIKE